MSPLFARLAAFALALLVVLTALAGPSAPSADAALPWRIPFFSPPPPAAPPAPPPIPPVADPISVDPDGPARGTVIMVHAGGWAGHDAYAQDMLAKSPGDLFVQRGWRVVSIDYEDGTAGLQDVLNAAGAELARGTGSGPLCIYGESSGAHLALVAAARLRAVDCVIGLGTPADLELYRSEGSASSDKRVRMVVHQIERFFGTTLEEMAPWDLLKLAPSIHADVMLIHEADDVVVPPEHSLRFQAARPSTQVVALEAGDLNDSSTDFMHGTISAAGRARYAEALGSFADRAVAARDAERRATRTGCAQVARSLTEIGRNGVLNALRCLARKDSSAQRAGAWQESSINVRGEVNAARIWTQLRATRSGRRALGATAKRRAKLVVKTADRSRVTLRTRAS